MGSGNKLTWTPLNIKTPLQEIGTTMFGNEHTYSRPFSVATFLMKVCGQGLGVVWVASLSGCAVIVARNLSGSPAAHNVLRASLVLDGAAKNIRLSRGAFCRSLLVKLGASIRLLCYRALGRILTFQLGIREEHALVTSSPILIHAGTARMVYDIARLILRTDHEDGALSAQFGDELAIWANRVSCKIFPWVY
ncbi:hypothetical protein PLICRDRAFT_543179 [Plicaturopsis crispa FD-325 SS-3]|nr:hypothetical protein PLICRDRAFT_543179 [Plicaturopsis crispa FD-325 SS-3]